MQYEVWISCTVWCDQYEDERMILATIDPTKAIHRSIMSTDQLHTTVIREITPEEIVKRRCIHGYGPGDHHYESGQCHNWPTNAWPENGFSHKKVVF